MKPPSLEYVPLRLLACVISGLISLTQSAFLPSIQWTPDNPMIQNLKGQVRKVRLNDGLNIWCPKDFAQLVTTADQVHPAKLYMTLYKVETKEEFDNCDATKGKKLLECNDPEERSSSEKEDHPILFIEKPFHKAMDAYSPGNMFYFIGTTNGKLGTINNKRGGKCATDNLKLAIYVCKEDEEDCEVDVKNGGWSLWLKNKETGLCERNCTNPKPQNGGYPCRGPSVLNCSEVITEKKADKIEIKPTTERATEQNTNQKWASVPTTSSTMTGSGAEKDARVITEKRADKTEITGKSTESPIKLTTERATEQNTNQKWASAGSVPTTSSTMTGSGAEKDARDDPVQEKQSDEDSVSMKTALPIFIVLFLVGCLVGALLFAVIHHILSKRSTKQAGSRGPINHV